MLVIFLRLIRPERFLNPDEIVNVFQFIKSMQVGSEYYFPFYWIAEGIVAALRGDWKIYFHSLLLFSLVLLILNLYLFFMRTNFYFRIYEKISQGLRVSYKSRWKKSKSCWKTFSQKEMKSFFRSMTNWSQLLILIALIVLFAINLKYIPVAEQSVKLLATYLNILLIGFIIAGIAARFVLPVFAVEAEGMAILFSSPLNRRKLVKFKFFFYQPPLLALALIMFWIGHLVMGYETFSLIAGTIYLFFSVLAVSAFAFYSGVKLDILSGKTPQQLIVSRQGLLFMFYSLLYVLLNFIFLIPAIIPYYKAKIGLGQIPVQRIVIVFLLFAAVNFLLTWIFFLKTQKDFQKLEI